MTRGEGAEGRWGDGCDRCLCRLRRANNCNPRRTARSNRTDKPEQEIRKRGATATDYGGTEGPLTRAHAGERKRPRVSDGRHAEHPLQPRSQQRALRPRVRTNGRIRTATATAQPFRRPFAKGHRRLSSEVRHRSIGVLVAARGYSPFFFLRRNHTGAEVTNPRVRRPDDASWASRCSVRAASCEAAEVSEAGCEAGD